VVESRRVEQISTEGKIMDMYWYTGRNVVFASSRSIANWYVKNNPYMRNCTFIKKETRNATDNEGTTVLAHNADKALRDARENWRANGGSSEYQRTLDSLAKRLK
jgi:hypothetical protein